MKLSAFAKVAVLATAVIATPAASYAQGLMEKIKTTGTFKVATDANYPPFEFIKDGKIVGMARIFSPNSWRPCPRKWAVR